MRILVFGASGHTGHEVVRQALARQHAVTAFVRRPEKLQVQHDHLTVATGDVGDAAAVRRAVGGHDVVVSTLGTVGLRHDQVLIDGVGHIVAAMGEAGVKRLIYQSFIGVAESRAAVGVIMRFIAPIPLRDQIRDHEAKEAIVKASQTDWTIVRPPKLTDGPATGAYRAGEDITTRAPMPTLSRADVAAFIVREIEQPAYVRKMPRLLR